MTSNELAATWNQQAASQTALDALMRFQWSVFPLDENKRPPKTGGTYPDGTPKRLSWKYLQIQRPSPKQLIFWRRTYTPDAWAVITGVISGLVILDFDGEAGRDTCRRLGLDPHVQTGSGGLHVYFQHPGWRVPTLNGKSKQALSQCWPGLDIRADGGYAAFCGRNSSGPYIWLRDPVLEDPAILPEDLRATLGLLHSPESAHQQLVSISGTDRKPSADQQMTADQQRRANKLLTEALQRSRTGRNKAGFWLACQLRDHSYSQMDAEAIMLSYTRQVAPVNTKGQPEPYTFSEARESLASAYKAPPRVPRNRSTPASQSAEGNKAGGSSSIDSSGSSSGLCKIYVGGDQLREIVDQSVKAVAEREVDAPRLFLQFSRLVSVGRDERQRPRINQMGITQVREVLTQSADFYRLKKSLDDQQQEDTNYPIPPPKEVAEQILARQTEEPFLPFPKLVGLVEMPVVRPDGSILDQPGYDSQTGLYYAPPKDSEPCRVSAEPTPQECTDALALIWDTIGEFPYVDQEDRANALALLMTPMLRPLIQRHIPLALLDAPKPGSGKGLFADVVSVMATGRCTPILAAPNNEEEWEKRITAILIQGQTIICLDNLHSRLQSAQLDAVLTSDIHQGRLLGHSTMVQVPNQATWIATGNNIRLGGDLARRTYRIRLDPKTSRPWMRTGFRHPDLISWVSEQRMALVGAILTLIRAWYVAGQPQARGVPTLGTFSPWANTVGSILAHAGVPGFLGNLTQLYEESDETSTQWETFLQVWYDTFGSRWVKAVEVVCLLSQQAAEPAGHQDQTTASLSEALPEWLQILLKEKPNSFKTRFGQELKKHINECFGKHNLYLEQEKQTHSKIALWRVTAGNAGNAGNVSVSFYTEKKPDYQKATYKNHVENDWESYPRYPQVEEGKMPQSGLESGSTPIDEAQENVESAGELPANPLSCVPPVDNDQPVDQLALFTSNQTSSSDIPIPDNKDSESLASSNVPAPNDEKGKRYKI